ncbi:pickpocket protein 11-like isoform X2 [Aricia agestis]|uniref:pickpocket protein 11-like isoform X2 n=1 Tax=Aricia agestis TaxID=91739 RepID=UPI001C209F18|nr:pickpocket protein 11-like isoform X2 [Aricia agestis]
MLYSIRFFTTQYAILEICYGSNGCECGNELFRLERILPSYHIMPPVQTGYIIHQFSCQLINPREYALVAAKMFRLMGNSLHANRRAPILVDAAMTEMGMCHIINSNVAIFDKPEHWNDSLRYERRNIDLSVYDKDFFVELNNYAKVYKACIIFYCLFELTWNYILCFFHLGRGTFIQSISIFQVFIHSPDEAPIRTTPSFTFDFEGIMSFGLSVWSTRISEELRHQSLRIRKCRFTTEPRGNRYPVYSYNHCILECRINMIKKLCGCVPHFYKPLSHERVCYVQELLCVLKYRREIVTLAATEQTRKEFHYSKDIPTHSRDCECINSCEFDLYYKDREDYEPIRGVNKLSINITSFPKVRIVRDIIFSFYDILLRSGGVINLCIGSSILSIVEFIVVIMKTTICITMEASRILPSFCLRN